MHRFLILAFLFPALTAAQDEHHHPVPEKLGTVSFPTTCKPATQREFDRAVALLHSFAYDAAEASFQSVAAHDPQCAMAHWGIAMTHFHQLWEPPVPVAGIAVAQKEISQAETLEEASARERGFIHALALVFKDASTVPYSTRVSNYENAMRDVAAANQKDVEAQVFYALALISALPDPCLRQSGTRIEGPASGKGVRNYRSIGSARTAHAVAHLHAARALG